ncbi:hypothetical protein [Bosea sp. BIWAKO-01]|uniref:hypothetical protein n=1 Tax=Bosea sp. BIWAKO-01 TaxID=506668 RepID=UPI00114CC083|nr:hypothetical protein [Bosea sp. BIWAKO-01]
MAAWGAGWALALYALFFLLIFVLVKFLPRSGDNRSVSDIERRSLLRFLAVTAALLIVASIGYFLFASIR